MASRTPSRAEAAGGQEDGLGASMVASGGPAGGGALGAADAVSAATKVDQTENSKTKILICHFFLSPCARVFFSTPNFRQY